MIKTMDTRKFGLSILLVLAALGVFAQSKPPSHDAFDKLLKKYVLEDGRVSYKGFIQDSVAFNKYLIIY